MTVVAEYDDMFTIYSERGKLFVVADSTPPREVKEVYRIKYPESEQYSDTEILGLCPEEYDYSGEYLEESDYVFWKCVDDEPSGLKVSPELDKRYSKACRLCMEKHKAIYGTAIHSCAFRQFDNEYCPAIVEAEKQRKDNDVKFAPSEHLRSYLKMLENGDGHSYNHIIQIAPKLSKVELVALVRAFDYVIAPYINHIPHQAYQAVARFTCNELRYGHSVEHSENHKPLAERIAEFEK